MSPNAIPYSLIRSTQCKSSLVETVFQLLVLLASRSESRLSSAVPVCSRGIFPQALVEKEACPATVGRTDSGEILLKKRLGNDHGIPLFCSVGCWVLVR